MPEVRLVELKCYPKGSKISCYATHGEVFSGDYNNVVVRDEQGDTLVDLYRVLDLDKNTTVMGARISTSGIRDYHLMCHEEDGVLECRLERGR
ncbi:MAG: hypothetical protein ACTSPB_07220 [Candidatus Thorarchaeota archaeon]